MNYVTSSGVAVAVKSRAEESMRQRRSRLKPDSVLVPRTGFQGTMFNQVTESPDR